MDLQLKNTGKSYGDDALRLKHSFEHRPNKGQSSKSVGRNHTNAHHDLSSLMPEFLVRPKYGPLEQEGYQGERDFQHPSSLPY